MENAKTYAAPVDMVQLSEMRDEAYVWAFWSRSTLQTPTHHACVRALDIVGARGFTFFKGHASASDFEPSSCRLSDEAIHFPRSYRRIPPSASSWSCQAATSKFQC